MSDHTDNLPQHVKDAINELTAEEFGSLFISIAEETGEFEGLCFIGPEGKTCRWADPRRARILQVMDDQIRKELGDTPCQMTM